MRITFYIPLCTMYVRAPVQVCRGISVCNDYTSTCVGGWSYSLTITRFRLTKFSGSPLIVRYVKPRSEPECPLRVRTAKSTSLETWSLLFAHWIRSSSPDLLNEDKIILSLPLIPMEKQVGHLKLEIFSKRCTF